ncbi:hemin uptake protein HemP [Caenimonas sp. SL110]|uniref:hemin uptake protein HemP n=1 Tax=Caenimonas sp. SL110 TaxID=1450524 RepID=UPI0006539235|nr:hemin uptake protein HemP [Caenimonas sp. SL110]
MSQGPEAAHSREAGPACTLATGCADAAPPSVASSVLLQGGRTVNIVHNGSVYRLQATRLGKLILTK